MHAMSEKRNRLRKTAKRMNGRIYKPERDFKNVTGRIFAGSTAIQKKPFAVTNIK